MTADTFRALALSLPDVVEQAHMGHPDFRVEGRIFATLDYPQPGWAVVALTPFDQEFFVKTHPPAFVPVKGKWGDQGATNIVLRHGTKSAVAAAMRAAYDTRLARTRKARKRARGGIKAKAPRAT
ncbi:MAG: MmcQ/YjbR family DNA-binding protein [Gemmatimonadaceae bacterium]